MDPLSMQAWHARVVYKSDSIGICWVFLYVVLGEVNIYFGLFFFALVVAMKYFFFRKHLDPILRSIEGKTDPQ